MMLPDGRNQRGSLEFVSDALTDGRRFRIFAVVDDFSRENLVLVADTSLSDERVARELDRVIAKRGTPKTIVSHNGSEFTSMAIQKWVQNKSMVDTTFRLESPSRTVSLKVSTASYETNVSIKRCLVI